MARAAQAVAATDRGRAEQLADDAEQLARSITRAEDNTSALVNLAQAAAISF